MTTLSVTKKYLLALLFTLVFIGIPILIIFGIIDFAYKFYALTIGGIVVYVFCRLCGLTNTELGITARGIKKSILYVMPVTLILAVVGLALWILGYSRITPNESWYFFIFYIFVSSPIQEFLYRGSLEALFSQFKFGFLIKLFLTSALYSFVHIIYKDALTLALTFVIGLVWYYCYQKNKNLTGVSISHAVLGIVTIVAGIIN